MQLFVKGQILENYYEIMQHLDNYILIHLIHNILDTLGKMK